MKKNRLLLVEDDRLIRDGLLSITKCHKDILIITWSGDLKDILAKIEELNPSVVLIDLDLLSQSCLSVIEIIKRDINGGMAFYNLDISETAYILGISEAQVKKLIKNPPKNKEEIIKKPKKTEHIKEGSLNAFF